MEHRGESAAPAWLPRLVAVPAAVSLAAMLASRYAVSSMAAWDVAWTAAAITAVAGTALARDRADAGNRRRWTLWTAACAAWLIGQLGWDVFTAAGTPISPNVADVGWWAFAILMSISMIRLPSGSHSLRALVASETLPLVATALTLTGAYLWQTASHSALPLAPKLSALAYPAVYVTAAVLTVQAMIGGSLAGRGSTASRLVLGGIVFQAIAFVWWSPQLLDQSWVPGATLIDPLWSVGMLAIGAGGALAALNPERTQAVSDPSQRGGILPAAMFLLLLAAFVQARIETAPAGETLTLLVGLLFSGATLMARSALLERRLRALLDRERAALKSLAERESELARLNERLVEDSRRDPLTGMRNRRALADDLPTLEAIHQERGDQFAIALCDIDHFKAYNDRLGHLAGDQALRAIASIVSGALRSGDVSYRYGGEELLLVLRASSAGDAHAASERVRAAVHSAALPHPDGIDGVLTVSIGVAVGAGDAANLLACADAALYEAKRGGRNRVRAATETEQPAVEVRPRVAPDEEPAPRHLRGMLTVSRAAAAGVGVMPVLESLAETIRSELCFQVVAVNLLDEARVELRVVVVLGHTEARDTLLGTSSPWSHWQPVIESEHKRCGAIWLAAGSHEWTSENASTANVMWTPMAAPALGRDAWNPQDMLLLPLRGASGEVMGVVSVDQPLNGRRPDDAELMVLMAVVDHAGIALEQVMRDQTQSAALREESREQRLAALMLLAEALDLRDPSTARHSRTVGGHARDTAVALGLPDDRIQRIHAAGVLHDLGKLGIADAILYKPDALDEAEWREIRRHPDIGAQIIEHAGLEDIAAWVRAHHERLDARGYPDKLPAGEIPLEARILAVADAYEAMVADRPYRAGMSAGKACAELVRCAGTQFDPHVVDVFVGTLRVQPGVPAAA